MVTFTIPGRLPCLNDHLRATNANRYSGASLKSDTEEMIAWCIRAAKLTPIAGRVRVHFDWHEPNARRDPDGIRFAAKYILDCLQPFSRKCPHGTGIIEGDSQRFIAGLSDGYHVDRENPRVVVTITPA